MARREEQILEDFQLRDLGRSGLAGRAIQQANLPRLQESLAESRATQAELGRQRAGRFAGRVASQQSRILRELGTRSGKFRARPKGQEGVSTFNPKLPTAVLVAAPQTGPGEKTKFGVTFKVGGTGQDKTEKFETFAQLQKFVKDLRSKGIQVAIPGAQTAISAKERELLTRQGVVSASDQAVLAGFQGRQRQGILSQFGALSKFQQVAGRGRGVDKDIEAEADAIVQGLR